MSKRISIAVLVGLTIFSLSSFSQAQSNLTAKAGRFRPRYVSVVVESDRIKDGLVGPVRRVRTEIVKLSSVGGRIVEGKRALLEVVSYDIRGNKVENQYYPVASSTLTGKEVYKYNDKGNISEMTLLTEDGSLVGKETYKYEFDFAGNWNKMTTTVAVVEEGKLSYEPTEVTYRSIMYYLDENMVKIAQPAAQPGTSSAAPVGASGEIAKANLEVKLQPVDIAPPVNAPVTRQKSATLLPESSNGATKLRVMSASDLRDMSANRSTNSSMVVLEGEPPPSASPNPILKAVSGGVLNGIAISLPTPSYPETARKMRVSGVVTVDVVIDEVGKVISAQSTGGPKSLREAAVEAALRARFSPTKLSGQPMKVSGVINYKFSLQ